MDSTMWEPTCVDFYNYDYYVLQINILFVINFYITCATTLGVFVTTRQYASRLAFKQLHWS